jgi:hypothetical protein
MSGIMYLTRFIVALAWENLKERDNLEVQAVRVRSGFIWLRILASDWLL